MSILTVKGYFEYMYSKPYALPQGMYNFYIIWAIE